MPLSRIALLHLAMDKALMEARSSFSISQAIQECYGDDSSIFGGNAVLEQVVDGMLDKVHLKVKDDMNAKLQQRDIEAKLVNVDVLLDMFQKEENALQEKEYTDRTTALHALQQTKLPPGLTAEMIIEHRAFLIKRDEKESLENELSQLVQEIKDLEELNSEADAALQSRIELVEQKGKDLERTADLCSFVSYNHS